MILLQGRVAGGRYIFLLPLDATAYFTDDKSSGAATKKSKAQQAYRLLVILLIATESESAAFQPHSVLSFAVVSARAGTTDIPLPVLTHLLVNIPQNSLAGSTQWMYACKVGEEY